MDSTVLTVALVAVLVGAGLTIFALLRVASACGVSPSFCAV